MSSADRSGRAVRSPLGSNRWSPSKPDRSRRQLHAGEDTRARPQACCRDPSFTSFAEHDAVLDPAVLADRTPGPTIDALIVRASADAAALEQHRAIRRGRPRRRSRPHPAPSAAADDRAGRDRRSRDRHEHRPRTLAGPSICRAVGERQPGRR